MVASAAGPNAIVVTWSGVLSSTSGSKVSSYRVEVYTASPTVSESGSFFGQVTGKAMILLHGNACSGKSNHAAIFWRLTN